MKTLKITLRLTGATEKYCGTDYSDKKKVCPFVATGHYGLTWHCRIFGSELRNEKGVKSGDGFLCRMPECLAADIEDTA